MPRNGAGGPAGASGPVSRRRDALAPLAILALAAALRVAMLPGTSLGYDALQSATHAARGIPTGLLSAFLHDPHPPLYYALLGLWMHLGTSDAALLSLSALLSLATLASLHAVARPRWGAAAANAAALAFALEPLALYWSAQARMYALAMLLAVWVWHFMERLASGSRRAGALAGAVASELALVYTHAASPLFLACLAASVAPALLRDRGALRRFAAAQALVAAGALPYLAFAATTHPEHLKRPGLDDLVRALAMYTSGVATEASALAVAGAAGFALVAALLVRRRETRAFALGLLVLPFAAGAAASHLVRPLWYAPRLFAFVAPFFALGLGRLAARAREEGGASARLERGAAAAAFALLAAGALATVGGSLREERYVDAAAQLRADARAGDLVLVPTLKDKWALAWYLDGPGWARGAVAHGPLDTLCRVASRESRRELLGALAAYGRDASGEALPILPASELDAGALASAQRVWVVARSAADADALAARTGLPRVREDALQGLWLRLLARPAPAPDPAVK